METLAYDLKDGRQSWIVGVGKVELSSTLPIVTTVPIWENFYGNTHRRRSAIIADALLLNFDHVDLISQFDSSCCCYVCAPSSLRFISIQNGKHKQ